MRSFADVSRVFSIDTLYTAFKNRFSADYFFSGETHNFYEIVTVTDGCVGVTAGSEVYVLHKGEAIIHEPMEFHSIWSEGGARPEVVIFTFSADNLPPYTSKIFTVDEAETPRKILEHLKAEFDIQRDSFLRIKNTDGAEYQIALKELEIFILQTISKNIGAAKKLSSRTAKNYAAAVKLLEENLDKRLRISDIAALCNMSEVNLKKTFSKYAGLGVMEYFNALKINAAKRMLLSGSSVKECAISLGFQNQNYFSLAFKRLCGVCPSEFKGDIDYSLIKETK